MMNGLPDSVPELDRTPCSLPCYYTEHIVLDTAGDITRTSHRTIVGTPRSNLRYRVAMDLHPQMRTRRHVSTLKVDLTSGDTLYSDVVDIQPQMALRSFSETIFAFAPDVRPMYKTRLTYRPSTCSAWYVTQLDLIPTQRLDAIPSN